MSVEYKEIKDFTVQELQNLFISVEWLSGNYPERLAVALKNSSNVISAWENEKLIGLVDAIDDGELTAYVHYLLINPEYQGKGIGKELMRRIKEIYKSYLYIILISETESKVAFYKKCGFKVFEGGIPMVIKSA